MDIKRMSGNMVRDICKEYNVELSTVMPEGYEEAYGTFDVTINTLFINSKLLKSIDYKTMFYLYHEIRHVQQYKNKQIFSEKIQQSLDYVILYNGVAFKLKNNEWIKCTLDKGKDYSDYYLSLPYEEDANNYAHEMTMKIFPNNKLNIKELYQSWKPRTKIAFIELKKVFNEIDKKTEDN